ncbi:MAG: vWA domain-containing protein [Solirubrobacteraceae bacterium]
MADFTVDTIELDLPVVTGSFSRRLHDAGVPTSAERAARFAQSLALVAPISRRRLYWTARAVFVSDASHVRAFDSVFFEVFGVGPVHEVGLADEVEPVPAPPHERRRSDHKTKPVGPVPLGAGATSPPGGGREGQDREREVPFAIRASDEEVLRDKRFDALEPDELAQIYRLMTRLRVATPVRRTRRARRDRHGERIDMRRTLRGSLRTGGDPIRLARRRRRVVRRRMVMLCDISGSMEPYARAYLQFLTSAAGGGIGSGRVGEGRSEAFVFATRLTRVTRALQSRSPERAIQRAAAAAPDWSSGTRIGDALKEFNDRHGRRGMARGAVIVILSDGWERGAPEVVGKQMERLARLAHRIVWVNPRVAAAGFQPRAGGMVAALPHCDALVSGHSLRALEEVAAAIGGEGSKPEPPPPAEPEDETWASATPVQGSSVAMPSGYGPSRGRTTPGWGPDGR